MILAYALLLLSAPPVAAAAPPLAPAQSQANVQMEHVSIRAIGSGDPVVLIPGLASPREVYDAIAADLARNRRVLLVQVNGFGGDAARGNVQGPVIACVVADIAAYLRRERLKPAAVIGHSLGGVVGMRLARDHAALVDRLMIVDALPFIGMLFRPDATVETLRLVAEAMKARMLAAASAAREASPDDPNVATMSISAEGRRQVSAWGVAADPQVVAQALVEDMAEDLRPDLPVIAKVPTTLLYAVPPPIAAQARALWTGAYAPAPAIRLVPVENSFHFIMLDQPERFAREVAAFLER